MDIYHFFEYRRSKILKIFNYISLNRFFKMKWIVFCLVNLVIILANGQTRYLDFHIGANITRPHSIGEYRVSAKYDYNFFLGIGTKFQCSERGNLNLGIFANGLNYYMKYKDSGKVVFISLRTISIPLQLSTTIFKNTSLLYGIEPKLFYKGYENSSPPFTSKVIAYGSDPGFYNKLNMGIGFGIQFNQDPFSLIVQYSRDIKPFYNSGQQKIYDNRIAIGVTFFRLKLSE